MKVLDTNIKDVKIIIPQIFEDDRGYFFESYNLNKLSDLGLDFKFIQDNESKSKRGTLRGLHFQSTPYAQTKLVRVVEGVIWDVAVDMRKSSETFLKHVAVELSSENRHQLVVPKGFAHGFVVLSESAVVQYKVDQIYSKAHDKGIRFDDEQIGISWPAIGPFTLSEKDQNLSRASFAEFFD